MKKIALFIKQKGAIGIAIISVGAALLATTISLFTYALSVNGKTNDRLDTYQADTNDKFMSIKEDLGAIKEALKIKNER